MQSSCSLHCFLIFLYPNSNLKRQWDIVNALTTIFVNWEAEFLSHQKPGSVMLILFSIMKRVKFKLAVIYLLINQVFTLVLQPVQRLELAASTVVGLVPRWSTVCTIMKLFIYCREHFADQTNFCLNCLRFPISLTVKFW